MCPSLKLQHFYPCWLRLQAAAQQTLCSHCHLLNIHSDWWWEERKWKRWGSLRMIRTSREHRYWLIIFQIRLGIWNNISHAGTPRRTAHFSHPRLCSSLCLPASLAAPFYILLHQILIGGNERQICTPAFSFMFVPFVPLLLPSVSPKHGRRAFVLFFLMTVERIPET